MQQQRLLKTRPSWSRWLLADAALVGNLGGGGVRSAVTDPDAKEIEREDRLDVVDTEAETQPMCLSSLMVGLGGQPWAWWLGLTKP